MDDTRIGRAVRQLRHRRGWRQRDLAVRSGVSKSAISDIERGHIDRYTLATSRRVLRALDARLELAARWGGHGELERLLDADHAALVRDWAARHEGHGWETWPEASYSIFGERGRVDLLSFHARTGVLEVAECKTALVDLQETLGRLDAKVRLGPTIALQRGWRVRAVVGALVVAEGSTARRRIAGHAALFASYPTRGRAAHAFVRAPTHAAGGVIVFLPLASSGSNHRDRRRAGRRRVRLSDHATRSAGRPIASPSLPGERVSGQ